MQEWQEEDEEEGGDEQGERRLACSFNVYHRTLMPSTYYYAYTGTLPEPPCDPNADWRVVRTPMLISPNQLAQLKSLLEDGVCTDHELGQDLGTARARPLQPFGERPYWQCRRNDFPLDCERDNGWCDCDATLCPADFMD